VELDAIILQLCEYFKGKRTIMSIDITRLVSLDIAASFDGSIQ